MTAAALASGAATAHQLPEPERDEALRQLLRTEVHDAVMRMSVDASTVDTAALDDLAATIRDTVPDGVEDGLPPRIRIFVRLLRRGDYEPAWTLAHDNASGVLQPTRASSMWAGGSFLNTRLPLPTFIEDRHVYAWLPGLRDPRWNVSDAVYALDRDVVVRTALDEARLVGGELVLAGAGYLGLLDTDPADEVWVAFEGPDDAVQRVSATRSRRSSDLRPNGPEFTRLSWNGWSARFPLRPLLAVPGTWRASLEITAQGVSRTGALGRKRGPLVDPELTLEPYESGGCSARVDTDASGRLVVRVVRLGTSARMIPRPVRRALRQVRAQNR